MNFPHGKKFAALAPKGTKLGAAAIAGIMVLWLPAYSLAGQLVGRQIYEERCVLCHGKGGHGWDWAIKAEKPPVPVPNLVKVIANRTDAYLVKIIKFGGSSVGLTSFMPAFGFNMEDQQVSDLVAYLRTLQRGSGGIPSSHHLSAPGRGGYRVIGKGLYEERCALCHGERGQGWDWAIKAAEPLVPVPNLEKVIPDRSDEYLVRIIRFGGASVGLTSFMPAFGFNMQKQQVWDVVAYLRTLQHPAKGKSSFHFQPSPVRARRGYRVIGKEIYEERCVLCHGREGKGWDWAIKAKSPPVPVPNLVEAVPGRSDDYLIRIIRFGGESVGRTPFMPAFGFNLREQQVWDVAAYLRNLSSPGQGLSLSLSMARSRFALKSRRGGDLYDRAATPTRSHPWAKFTGIYNGDSLSHPAGRNFRRSNVPPSRQFHGGRLLRNSWLLAHQDGPGIHRSEGPQGPQGYRTGVFPHAIAVADFNKDGIPDLAIPAAGERQVAILLGDGKAGIVSNHSYPVGKGPTWVDVADLNRDGNVDIVVTNTGAGSLTLYYGDGKGGMGNRRDIKGIHGPSSVVILDLDQDGWLDLAVTQAAQARIAILINDRKGLPKLQYTVDVNLAPHIMDKADLNGDGIDDLVVGSLGTHTLTVLLGSKGGSPADPIVVKVGRFPHYRVYGDFNKDGKMDAAVAVAGEDAVQILIGDGAGHLAITASITIGVNPHGMVGGDFNGDGNLDLIISNRSSRDAIVLLGGGDGKFKPMPPFATGHDIISLSSADFNRDGQLDLAMVSASSDSVIFYLGDGSGKFRPIPPN